MAATGGVPAPLPPKRPTVIRPGGSAVPSRPAPPLPARIGEDISSGKNAESHRQHPPPPPARPNDRAKQSSDNSSATSTTGKKRLEITIISARPMSEIGFRNIDASGSAEPKPVDSTKTDNELAPKETQQPIIRPPPRPKESVNTATTAGVRVPPSRPTVIRPTGPPGKNKLSLDDTKEETSLLVRQPPAIPRHPPSPKLRASVNGNELVKSLLVPNGAPVPVPRNVPVRKDDVNDDIVHDLVDVSVEDKTDGLSEPMYSVINKPKKPTIIRPNRPTVKETSATEQVQQSDDKTQVVPAVPPKMFPSLTPDQGDNEESSSSNILSSRKSFFERKQEEVPEFLTKRLKATVQSENDINDLSAKQAVSKPPPPLSKPKPTIVPKPQIAAKPTVAKKPTVTLNETITKDTSNNTQNIERNSTSLDQVSTETDISKSFVKKRPTIIRPSRVVQSSSPENVGSIEQLDANVESVRLRSSDDNLNRLQSRPKPPPPSKRPVSMINIPDALAQEEKKSELALKSHHFVSSSTENINKGPPSHSTVPRPMARPRPASMMISSNSRPPLPSSGPKVQPKGPDASSPPLRPQQRPSLTGQKEIMPARNDNRMSALGVAVLPRLGKMDSEVDHDLERNKPARGPPPPRVTQDVESSSEEEFFTAQSKPDRPAGPPKPRSHTLSQDTPTDFSADKKAPPRPTGAPEPPRKTSVGRDNDESSQVELRSKPNRPNSKPPRPVSVAVKFDQASRQQPARPGGSPSKRKPSGAGLPPRPGPDHPLYRYMMQAPHGIALFDYTARQQDELELKQGEVIILKKVVDSEWLVGQVGDREGMFPKGFIKVKMPLPGQEFEEEDSSDDGEEMLNEAPTEKPDIIGYGPRCRARFDFDGEGEGDLPFEEGDMIKLLERVGNEWRKGDCNGRVGVFPIVFVEVIEDLPEEDSLLSNTVKAMFDFDGDADDLSFQAGEIIHVKYKISEEWLYGEIGERSGQFPVQFIDHVPSELPAMPSTQKQEVVHSDPLTSSLSMWDTVDDIEHKASISKEETKPVIAPEKPKRMLSVEEPFCIAVHDYHGETAEDLTFSTGDRIVLVERINDDWLKGCCHGNTGMFPAAFVDVQVDMKAKESANTPFSDSQNSDTTSTQSDTWQSPVQTEVGVAQYDFVGEGDNELTFSCGDRIELQEHVTGAEDWRYGVLDGKRGIFPASFVLLES